MVINYDPDPLCGVCDPRFPIEAGRTIGSTLQSSIQPNEPLENTLLKVGLAGVAIVGVAYGIGKVCERPTTRR